jgi:hypothetical protein
MTTATLPATFRFDHDQFGQREREGDVAWYVRTSPSGRRHHEVVIVQHRPACTIAGHSIPAHEAMPGSEQWGRYGWTYPDAEGAKIRFAATVTAARMARESYKGRGRHVLMAPATQAASPAQPRPGRHAAVSTVAQEFTL